eukprot:scaffold55918_cov35-Tisochrysis_lutea.AAC.3
MCAYTFLGGDDGVNVENFIGVVGKYQGPKKPLGWEWRSKRGCEHTSRPAGKRPSEYVDVPSSCLRGNGC